MSGALSSLPDLRQLNSEALRALILSQHERLTEQEQQIFRQCEQLASREAEIEHLTLLIAKLRRMQFGRRSEKVAWQIEQLELRLDELQASRAEQRPPSPAEPSVAAEAPRSTKPARRPLPAHLPRETRKIPPKHAACPNCGGELSNTWAKRFGDARIHPGKFQGDSAGAREAGLRPVRQDRASGSTEPPPIARGMAGPGLLAHVLVSKYSDHLPLYRQEEIYERQGVELDRATLADWVGGVANCFSRYSKRAAARDERDEAARRRYARSGTRARTGKNRTGSPVDLRAR